MDKIIFAHLNINSIKTKFDQLHDMIGSHIAVLVKSKSKLKNNFPDGQFLIKGYGMPFQVDRNKLGVVSSFLSAVIFLINHFQLQLILAMKDFCRASLSSLYHCYRCYHRYIIATSKSIDVLIEIWEHEFVRF